MATDQKALKIYIPQEDATKLEAIALRDDRTVTAIVRRLIRNYVADDLVAEAQAE